MINLEYYNKYINKRAYINDEIYCTQYKQELIELYEFKINEYSENINSWSSRKHDIFKISEALEMFRNSRSEK
jgi:hypothetical protein